jgi:hypothetical protein
LRSHGIYYALLLSALHKGMITLLVCLSSYVISKSPSMCHRISWVMSFGTRNLGHPEVVVL